MKKINSRWLDGIVFSCILVLLLIVMSYIPVQVSHEKNGNFWPYFYQELPKNSVDIIYLGNSHSKTTFIPEVIDNILGANSIHVNTSGESIFQSIYEYQEVLQKQNPDLVVLETNTIYAGLDQESLKPWNFSFFYSMPFGLRKIQYSLEFFSGMDLLYFFLPFTANHANWKNPQMVVERVSEELDALKVGLRSGFEIDLPHKGYENYLTSLPKDAYQSEVADQPVECPVKNFTDRLDVLEKILEINQNSAGDLLLLEAPQFINEYVPCRGEVIDIAEAYDTEQAVLMDNIEPSLLWFGDRHHMTQFGAVIASVEAAKIIAERFDFEVNQEKIDIFSTYFFREYHLFTNDSGFSLELEPFKPDALDQLNFIWEIFQDGESIHKFEGMGENKISYDMQFLSENDYVVVIIINPKENYYLRGRIILGPIDG